MARIVELRRAGRSCREVAAALDAQGHKPRQSSDGLTVRLRGSKTDQEDAGGTMVFLTGRTRQPAPAVPGLPCYKSEPSARERPFAPWTAMATSGQHVSALRR